MRLTQIPAIDKVPTARGRRPLTGHASAMNRDGLAFLRELREYGPMVRIFIGPRPVYVLNSPELAHQVLTVQARGVEKGAMFDTLRKPLGNGLVTSTGDFHLQQRRLLQRAFHVERLNMYSAYMSESCAARAASWQPGQQVELTQEINKLTLEILMRTLYTDPDPELKGAVRDWLRVKYQSMRLALSPRHAWHQRVGVIPGWQEPDAKPLQRLQVITQRIIDKYRADGADRGDLLSMLIAAEGPNGPMSDTEILDEIVTLYLSATGTIAAVLGWTMHEVANRPEIDQRLHAEVDAALGGRPPTYQDFPSLPYTRQVITEALRMYPAAWLSMRRTLRPMTLDGVTLPTGTDIFLSAYALHRDPGLYPDPDQFDPDRWPPERSVPRDIFLPFGAGNRVCIGEGFAWTELTIAVATFIGSWKMVPAEHEPVRTALGTVFRAARIPVTVLPRVSAGAMAGR